MTLTPLSNDEVRRMQVADALLPLNDNYVWEISKDVISSIYSNHFLVLVLVKDNQTIEIQRTFLKNLSPRTIRKESQWLIRRNREASFDYKEKNDSDDAVLGYYANRKTQNVLEELGK